MSRARLTACVMLPFAAGYFLSYLFRTINALIADDLAADLNLGAADLGFLTSIYFLVFAAVQLPFGALLDRHGPKLIQSALLLLASAGALVFALADGLPALIMGRALLALGVALALMAGFKAIVVWFPAERIVVANAWLVMLGALGAVTATAPAEFVVQMIGWRGLFAALAGLSALAALLVLLVVPDQRTTQPRKSRGGAEDLWAVYRDRRFRRIAPLSAVGIGTSWSLQGLWAAPWLRDVDGLDRAAIVQHLSAMALAVCAGALLLGTVASRFRRIGIKTELLLAATVIMSTAAQAALVLGWPIPSLVPWSIIAATGAATVLSFAILADCFPKEVSGRANAALNLLHVTAASILQSGAGVIIAQWPHTNGAYPLEAHQAAMTAGMCIEILALGWFALPRRSPDSAAARVANRRGFHAMRGVPATTRTHYPVAPSQWVPHQALRIEHVASWRLAAAAAAILCVGLSTALWQAAASTNRDILGLPLPSNDHRLSPTWAQAILLIDLQLAMPQHGQASITIGRYP